MQRLCVVAGFASVLLGQPARLLNPAQISQLESKVASGRASRKHERTLGQNYGFAILGVTELNRYGTPTKVEKSLRGGPAATHARDVLSSSDRAAIIGAAGQILWQSYVLCCEDADPANHRFGELLLTRAIELEPGEQEWRFARIGMSRVQAQGLGAQLSTSGALARMESDLEYLRGEYRVAFLDFVARMALRAQDLDRAEALARELLAAVSGHQKRWYYGNGIFYGNMVLGQVALRRKNIAAAKAYLLASGRTPGSPELKSSGPSMALAKELLNGGERDAVLEFLKSCQKFWNPPGRGLDRWIAEVEAGLDPDFRESLTY